MCESCTSDSGGQGICNACGRNLSHTKNGDPTSILDKLVKEDLSKSYIHSRPAPDTDPPSHREMSSVNRKQGNKRTKKLKNKEKLCHTN